MSRENPRTTRDRILEAARTLLEAQRGSGAPMRAIAEKAGVSRQAVYLHFASRAELLIATTRYLDERLGLDERMAATRRAKTGIDRMHAFIEFWGNYLPEIHGIATALLASRDRDEDAAAAWKDRMDAVRDGCRTTIEKLKADGMLAREWTVGQATDLLATLLSIRNWEQLTIERGWSTRRYIEGIRKLATRAFVAPGGT